MRVGAGPCLTPAPGRRVSLWKGGDPDSDIQDEVEEEEICKVSFQQPHIRLKAMAGGSSRERHRDGAIRSLVPKACTLGLVGCSSTGVKGWFSSRTASHS